MSGVEARVRNVLAHHGDGGGRAVRLPQPNNRRGKNGMNVPGAAEAAVVVADVAVLRRGDKPFDVNQKKEPRS